MSNESEIPEKSLVIETEEQSEAALEEILALMIKGNERTAEETERLRILSDAEVAYEEKAFPTEYVPPSELLSFLLEQNDLNIKKMSKQTGVCKKRIKALLGGAEFTVEEAAKIGRRFCLGEGRLFLERPPGNETEKLEESYG